MSDPFTKTDALDEVLLDVAALIELSPHDPKIAENRYRRPKTHLERRGSPLAAYLVDGRSLVYAQGSIATSTIVVSGTEDDRFDVDAVVEIDVPDDWDNTRALASGLSGRDGHRALHPLRAASVPFHAHGRHYP